MKKRLGIFQMHDAGGIADDYIFHLLDDLILNLSHLVIVCNGEMKNESLLMLKKYTPNVFVRENTGFDCTAFKEVFFSLYGWDNVYKFDELVLVNDSCYGPLFPLQKVFEEMETREADFWGITGQLPIKNTSYASYSYYLPYHIQPYFLVIKNKMLHSNDFKLFWDTLGTINNYDEAATNYKLRFTQYFCDLGYKCDSYIDALRFSSDNPINNYLYISFDYYTLISKYKCPFVKRQNFTFPLKSTLEYSCGEDARRTLDYIKNHTSYDENLIWDNLLRLYNISDLYTTLHLNYIFPSQAKNSTNSLDGKRIAVIAHMYYPDLIETCFEYLQNIPEGIDIIVTTNGPENREKIENYFLKAGIYNYRILEPENRGREISALLIACKEIVMQYDYLCFVHDKKTSGFIGFSTIGKSFMGILWNNTLKSREYIENAIDCFNKNPKLGILTPPCPYHSYYFSAIAEPWAKCFKKTKELAELLGLNCKLSPDKQPFMLGTAFWCRTAALKTLFEYGFEYSDFHSEPMPSDGTINHALERIFPYVAQHEGYYSAVMMSDVEASLRSTNYSYMLAGMISRFAFPEDIIKYSDIESIDDITLLNFCKEYKNIYIYGSGLFARKCIKLLNTEVTRVKGFVVSDGHRLESRMDEYEIYELSEIEPREDEGIILALGQKFQQEVLPILEERGFKNIIGLVS